MGIKKNIGIREAFGSDVVISFLANREFDWPENYLTLVRGERIIGEDVGDPEKLREYEKRSDCIVIGNIVVYYDDFVKTKRDTSPLLMVIASKPFPGIEIIPKVREARLASPSRFTDEYLKSKMDADSKEVKGTFIIGFNINTPLPENRVRDGSKTVCSS
jgi:hypothetical protein